ncbi:hypothetical protein AKJ16_DCAP02561 [Drosera capensis]
MGSIQPGEAVESPMETLSEASSSFDSEETIDPSGDPLLNPRVGDEYQVEIPALLTKFELLQYLKLPAEEPDGISDACHSFLIGQPIPITWINSKAEPIKDKALEFHESPNDKLHSNGSVRSKSTIQCNGSSFRKDPDSDSKTDPCCPVPGLSAELWSDFEVDCFLLGLYIFGKNLIQVARFVESKDVGQVLLFFYGKFYRSSGYCRWSDCRKMKRRKSIIESSFFTGCRQQELLSRLLSSLPEDCKLALQQISRSFADGRIELEDYVSDLKSLVGLRALVDAIGIGTKEDLTTLVMDSSRGRQTPSSQLKIPSGEAFSSLSCAEIVKLLSGDTRLTKAKSNDLFWAAVWPRLLARGWHSELSKGDAQSKIDLVFLIPDVKKFSKRKLRRREHYFDIVTDILKKVASEPDLLVLEGENNELVKPSKVNNGCVPEEKSDDDDDHERRCYLQPRVSNTSEDLMFTVVDTSLHGEGKPFVKRESRSLPLKTKGSSLHQIEENGVDSGERLERDLASTDLLVSSRYKDLSNGGGLQLSLSVLNHKKPSSLLVEGKPSTMKRPLSCQKTSDKLTVKKKRKLASGSIPDTTKRVLPWASAEIKREPICILSLPVVDEKTAKKAKRRQLRIQQEAEKELRAKSSCLQQDLGGETTFHNFLSPDTNLSEITDEGGPKMKLPIDLNLPPESPTELGTNEKSPVKEEGNMPEPNAAKPDITLSLNQHEIQESCPAPSKDPEKDAAEADDTGHGKRNRPMSTKELEALESYLLNPTSKKKRSSLVGLEGERRKLSRRARKMSFDNIMETETGDEVEKLPASRLEESSDKEGDRAKTPA